MNAPSVLFEPSQMQITKAVIAEAKKAAALQQKELVDVLQDMLNIEPEQFVEALGRATNYNTISMKSLHLLLPAFDMISFATAQQKNCLAFRQPEPNLEDQVVLVMANPFDVSLHQWATEFLQCSFSWRLAHQGDIAAFFAKHEESMRAMDNVHAHNEIGTKQDDLHVVQLSMRAIQEDANPTVKLINSTLYDALKMGASDIHFECSQQGLAVKYRIDGVISQIGAQAGLEMAEQAISRIKVLAQLDISERRTPQDGRFKANANGREVDFRVSIMPSIFGEDAVLRVLDRKALTEEAQGLSLHTLGFDSHTIMQVRRLAAEPYGMVLVTGPTGSGKTTSLYAAISEVNHGNDKIITIEDPVEYQLPGVLQIPVNEKKGLTFARGLRSILRHDPDKIMVGEIRDSETAQIAIQAALTGHLVFTTVHANNVLDVIGRFMHMGVDPYNFVTAINGILAQRLVRSLCRHCAEQVVPTQSLLDDSGLSAEQASHMRFMSAKGCGHCRGTGYKGRKAISELLVLNDELREMIVAREPIRKLKEAAKRCGMRTLRQVALEAVNAGETSLEEVNRVTFVH